jgi:tetratricopeptide (TPR) repeat protein
MDDAEQYFLQRKYSAAIQAYEQALTFDLSEQNRAMCWYMLGQSYLMSGNATKARAAYQTILTRYAATSWLPHAYLGQGDVAFHQKKYDDALKAYKNSMSAQFLRQYGANVYYRLLRVHRARGEAALVARYESVLRNQYPNSLEARLILTGKEVTQPPAAAATQFAVQVSFTPRADYAQAAATRLKKKGYDAYVNQTTIKGQAGYRVLVGHYQGREAADALARKLARAEKMSGFVTTIAAD